MQKKEFTEEKSKKLRNILIIVGLFTLIFSTLLVIGSLTFVIKKINLISRNPAPFQVEFRFDLQKAQQLFPDVGEKK